ncbi:MAG TPA: cyclic pyranopterin monophosphate synthase MoaC, partial [Flavobacteriaceae bacterium]|nr:cyclic pyranopterin monophosphate synthase MoaC [Flavobacteriaceae bacterium]
MSKFTHINKSNQPKMVNVGDKKITKRKATA